MIEVEKAVATYTLQLACQRAEQKLKGKINSPLHPKSFIKSLEEASKETDPLLHEMWTNILASQLSDNDCHPHFIELLSHLSSSDASLLVSLYSKSNIGQHHGSYMYFMIDRYTYWRRFATDSETFPWNYSCTLLCELRLADMMSPGNPGALVLCRTQAGDDLVAKVS